MKKISWSKYITNGITVVILQWLLTGLDHLTHVQADHTVLNWILAFGWVIIYNLSEVEE